MKNVKNRVLKLRAEACLNSMPAQLSKPYKKFKYSLVDAKGNSPEKAGIPLYYYHAKSGSPELDFLYEKEGEVTIVECKSTNNRATSMKFVLANPQKYGKHRAVKFSDTNVGKGDGFYTYPLYALGFLQNDAGPGVIDAVDISSLKVLE